ncbi:hypothetical protein Scep_009104 [Stephania cephalantha]|uniref:Acyl-CoA-binding domain-containing protein n=1 Tax=Stephania cephalantha TaxID=152367 RepID=A0AAP0JSJ7_9MAGN
MFGFSRRRMKLGRLKVHLSDSTQGTRSPMRLAKRVAKSNDEGAAPDSTSSGELNSQDSPAEAELPSNCASGSSESWMVLSTSGSKPTPRFDHAATVVGDKMFVVGGETDQGLLDDVQVLDFEKFTWATASSKLYLSPKSLPLKIPACKGHSLVSWGKTVLLVGGKTDHAGNAVTERISVWTFDTEIELWSVVEAKGEIPVARSGHTVVRAGVRLFLFGGEDARGKKLNDLHTFHLKSSVWLPLQCTGSRPSSRSNHVAAVYDDRIMYIFGGSSKSRTLNDLYSFDCETMIWSRFKIRGFHPSPRAGCCGVLCGYKWYIVGGGSRKKRQVETLVFDIQKLEWAVAASSPASSITTYKGFSLVFVQQKDKAFLVAFGGQKKGPSDQVEVLIMERNDLSMGRRSMLDKFPEDCSITTGLTAQVGDGVRPPSSIDSVVKQNLAAVLEQHGRRRSISETSNEDPNLASGSLQKQFHTEEDYNAGQKMPKNNDDEKHEHTGGPKSKNSSAQAVEQKTKSGDAHSTEDASFMFDSDGMKAHQKQVNNSFADKHDIVLPEVDGKAMSLQQFYETKIASLMRKNDILEEQLAAALVGREAAEKSFSSAIKSRLDAEKRLADTTKEMELLKEKVANMELAQEEANGLSNIVHSDNVRLEHDVAFLKAVLDDTQKELHSTRGVLAGERARAFQLQVEVYHLKQRLQPVDNRSSTPRKPFHM